MSVTGRFTYNLLAGPHWLRLEDSGRHRPDPAHTRVMPLGPQRTVDQLEVLLPCEKGRLVAQPDTSIDVVLDQASQRCARSRDEVLVVGVGDVVGFGPSDLVLGKVNVHFVAVKVGIVRVTTQSAPVHSACRLYQVPGIGTDQLA